MRTSALRDFCKANLSRADLGGADLGAANLNEADLNQADLSGAKLFGTKLSKANLSWANISRADLRMADLSGANLYGANLGEADLNGANLSAAKLREASLFGANLSRANLNGADLNRADLKYAQLSDTDLTNADLTGSRVYGISSWGLKLSESTIQRDLIITPLDAPQITADDIEIAQFLYLLIDNKKIRKVINTITSKVVLILGRFSQERKGILDAMREELRRRDLLPVIFDFSIPASRDVTETVKVLAGLSRFVIADITDATEVRVELHSVVKDFPSLPVQPILLRGQSEFVSVSHLRSFPWLLPTFYYDTEQHLLDNLDDGVIAPAQAKVRELQRQQI